MGYRRASLTHHPPQYVPACHWAGAEGSTEVHLLGLAAEPAKARPWGRCTCHATCRVPDLSERDQGPLPGSIFTKKVTWSTALQASMEGGGYQGHPVLPEEPLVQVWGHHHSGGGPMGGCCDYPLAHLPTGILLQVPKEKRPTWWELQEAREVHWLALEAAHMLELNIERLSQRVGNAQYWCPHSHSSSHLQSRSLDRCERSPDRHEMSPSQHRL